MGVKLASMGHSGTYGHPIIDEDTTELAPMEHAPGTALPWLWRVCDEPVTSPYQDFLVADQIDVGKADLCPGLHL